VKLIPATSLALASDIRPVAADEEKTLLEGYF